jgi:hypothetical protein
MTNDSRSKYSSSAPAILAAWAGARLRFRQKRDKNTESAMADGGEAADHATEGSFPGNCHGTRTRPKRYADAVAIIDLRVSDPSGIANAIVAACREVRAEGGSVRADAAVRLMVARLAWACGADSDTADYSQLVAICRLRAVSW